MNLLIHKSLMKYNKQTQYIQEDQIEMKDGSNCQNNTYYNQFIDLKAAFPLKSRLKLKTNNLDGIKIATKKLPPDFFRPYTRQNPNKYQILERQCATKTPCFGDDKKQSYSLSLIPKQKGILGRHEQQIQRVSTLPIHDTEHFYRANKKIFSSSKEEQYSYRQSKRKQLTRDSQHKSTERQKIKFKKLTLNDQLQLDDKKMTNLDHQNRIRLNIKKFFRQDNQFNTLQLDTKSGRKPIMHLNTIGSLQIYQKPKGNRLPPLL